MIVTLATLFLLTPSLALAIDTKSAVQCGINGANGTSDCSATPSTSLDDTIKTVINLLSVIVGIVAVIMIIIAGLKYITSAGDSNKVTSAKNTLLYAIIGLVIVALAQTIAHFALTEAKSPDSTGSKSNNSSSSTNGNNNNNAPSNGHGIQGP